MAAAGRRAWLATCLVFVVSLLAYGSSLNDTLAGGDMGEFVLNNCASPQGVSHPPGYPLMSLIGYITRALCGSQHIALALNCASAIIASLSLAVLFQTVQSICGGDLLAGSVAAALFGTPELTWTYATQFEVFSLNNLFVAVGARLLLTFDRAPTARNAILCSYFAGLALCNQHTIVFYVAVFAVYVAVMRRSVSEGFQCAVAFLVGLLPYAMLYFISAEVAEGSWGNLTNWEGFMRHILRQEYGTFKLFSGKDKMGTGQVLLSGLAAYLQHFLVEFTVFVGAVVVGIYTAVALATAPHSKGKQCASKPKAGAEVAHKAESEVRLYLGASKLYCSKWYLLVIVFAFGLYTILFHLLANLPIDDPVFLTVHARFWMQSNQFLSLLGGVGFHVMLHTAVNEKRFARASNVRAVVAMVFLAMMVPKGVSTWERVNVHNHDYVERYGRAYLDTVPEQSILVVWGDLQQFAIGYLQKCKGVRPDVAVVPLAHGSYQWFSEVQKPRLEQRGVVIPGTTYHPLGKRFAKRPESYNTLELIEANIQRREVWFVGDFLPNDVSAQAKYKLSPYGLARRVVKIDEVEDPDDWIARSSVAGDLLPLEDLARYEDGSWEAVIFRSLVAATEARCRRLCDMVMAHPRAEVVEAAALAQEDAVSTFEKLNIPMRAHMYLELGFVNQKQYEQTNHPDDYETMMEGYQKFLEKNPFEANPEANALQVTQVRQVLKFYEPKRKQVEETKKRINGNMGQ